jgi:hypothetical protein
MQSSFREDVLEALYKEHRGGSLDVGLIDLAQVLKRDIRELERIIPELEREGEIIILPEGMSRERFEWLSKVAGEVIATPGCESNIKEIFDKCWEVDEKTGEITQMFTSRGLASRENYDKRIYAKTASMFELATAAAAILSPAGDEAVENVRCFGYSEGA